MPRSIHVVWLSPEIPSSTMSCAHNAPSARSGQQRLALSRHHLIPHPFVSAQLPIVSRHRCQTRASMGMPSSPRLATPLPKQPERDGIDIRQRCTSAPVMPTRLPGVQTRLALNGRPLLPTPFRDANGPLRLEASMWNHQPHRTVLRRCCCTVLLRAFSRYIPSSTIVVCAHNAPSARSGQFKGRG